MSGYQTVALKYEQKGRASMCRGKKWAEKERTKRNVSKECACRPDRRYSLSCQKSAQTPGSPATRGQTRDCWSPWDCLSHTHTASAPNSLYRLKTTGNMSTRPVQLVSSIIGSAPSRPTRSSVRYPYVLSGDLVCHTTRICGRFSSPRNARHGPMPDPVVATTRRENSRIV